VSEETRRTPRGYVWASFLLTLCGLGAAAYLTYEHYTSSTTLACSDTGTINCLKVTTSSYSKQFGIPVALLGMLFFVAMAILCSPKAWSMSRDRRWIAWLRLAASAAGVLMVFFLVWAELFRIDAICLWCTAVHIITVLLFGVLVFAAALEPAYDPA
jgi:uncharacterized membrane protein